MLFYHGGNHGECVTVRKALSTIMQNKQIAIQRGDRKREFGFQSSIFCPIPIGDSPSSKRMCDVMHFGCIPVIVSDEQKCKERQNCHASDNKSQHKEMSP